MSCAHCCMSCRKGYKGQHMSQDVLFAALEWGAEYGQIVTLGGGEPLLHPHFYKFLAHCIEYTQTNGIDCPPWFATNGSVTKKVMELITNQSYMEEDFFDKLYQFAFIEYEEEMYSMALSQDVYHDPIEPKVVSLAKSCGIEIRDVTGKEINAGMCDFGAPNQCVCETFQVKPDGDVFLCGCDSAPRIGNVLSGMEVDVSDVFHHMDDLCALNINEDNEHIFPDLNTTMTLLEWNQANIIVR